MTPPTTCALLLVDADRPAMPSELRLAGAARGGPASSARDLRGDGWNGASELRRDDGCDAAAVAATSPCDSAEKGERRPPGPWALVEAECSAASSSSLALGRERGPDERGGNSYGTESCSLRLDCALRSCSSDEPSRPSRPSARSPSCSPLSDEYSAASAGASARPSAAAWRETSACRCDRA